MKQLILIILLSINYTFSIAQNEKAVNYIKQYKDAAIQEMKRSGVPASITLAQGMLESGYGESELCQKSNNHFGIKCKTEWTGAKVYHNDDEKGECFRAYPSAADSYRDHSDFLKSRPWYAFLFKLDPTDYEGWAYGLKKAGYATEKNYPQSLIRIIKEYNLQEHTLAALSKPSTPAETTVVVTETVQPKEEKKQADTVVKTKTAPVVAKVEPVKDEVVEEVETDYTETVVNPSTALKPDSITKKSAYPEGIFTINHAKVMYAKEGTALLALANQFGISLSNLLEFNDLEEMDVLDTDRLIFTERKLKKGAKDFYEVQSNESVHEICQKEGVQLQTILSLNKLQKNSILKKGDKVYLRSVTVKK